MRKHRVRVVHDDDLITFLDSIGLRHAIEAGKVACYICGETITLETLQALLPIGKNITAVCSRSACVKGIEKLTGDTL